jgi:hypothetical protein
MSASATTDPEGDALSFRWAQTSGAALVLADAKSAVADVTLPAGNAEYAFAVQANDGLQYGTPDVVWVRNTGFSGRPIALAGPDRTTNPGLAVSLDGRGSVRTDGGAGPLAFAWSQASGTDWYTFSFNQAAALTSVTLPADVSSLTPTRTVLFRLVVNDGAADSAPDLVAVTFTNLPLNGKPQVTANASDVNPVVGATVDLTATANDRDGDLMTFKWTQTSGQAVVLQPNSTSLAASFVAPAQGTLVFQFVADDGFEKSPAAAATVTVDRKPTAAAVVSPTSGAPGTLITFNASTSSDPEGSPLTFTWTQTAGTTVTIQQGQPIIQFAAPGGPVAMRLVVNDGRQDSAPLAVAFTGNPPPTVSPTSNATAGAAPYGSTVTLSANPGAGGPFTYTWRVASSTLPASVGISLSSTTAQNPTFVVPTVTGTSGPFGQSPSATFSVVANDGFQDSAERTVSVNFYASYNDTGKTTTTVWTGIIATRCASCHAGTRTTCPVGSGSSATGYGMGTAPAFLTNSQGVTSCASSKVRLPSAGQTGLSGQSYLLDRIAGTATPRMPTSGGSLPRQDIDFIQDWIDQGGQNN